MSIDNHPNFHACKFAANITASFFDCLRGKMSPAIAPDIKQDIVDFVAKIEEKVDETTDKINHA